jgi:nucleoside-diphosphate-sugar epimerase
LSGSIINVSGLENISLNHAIEKIELHIGRKAELVFEKSRIGDQIETIGADIEAWAGIDYSPKVMFEDGIKNQIDHIINENF